ncbi:MAG: hypothetical protein M0Q01_09055 [Syntrophales bacterium]|jgi:hypothetical protein|nr:hypothetical protein [Syntrophales bacterium]
MRLNHKDYGTYADTNRISGWGHSVLSGSSNIPIGVSIESKTAWSVAQPALFYDRQGLQKFRALEEEINLLKQLMIKHFQEHEQVTDNDSIMTMFASEAVLCKDWNSPEEDEAWADL